MAEIISMVGIISVAVQPWIPENSSRATLTEFNQF